MAGYGDIYGDIYESEVGAAQFLDGNLFVSIPNFPMGILAGSLIGELFISTSVFPTGSLLLDLIVPPLTGTVSDANRDGTVSTIGNMTVGETHTPQIVFTDANGDRYDPTVVFVTVRSPSGVASSPTVIRLSTGVYQAPFALTEAGIWRFEFHGEGPDGAIVIEGGSVCALAAVA